MYEISNYSGKIKKNGVLIPLDDSTVEFQQYKIDKSNGVEILFVDFFEEEQLVIQKLLVPKLISQLQLRTQLVLDGFNLQSIQNLINSLEEPQKSIADIAWNFANTFDRDSDLLNNLGYMLGLSSEQIDNVFINASKL